MEDAGSPGTVTSQRHRRILLGLVLLAVALRVAFVLWEPPSKLAGDENRFLGWALEPPGGVATAKVRFSPFRNKQIFDPPLYVYFVAAVHTLADRALGGTCEFVRLSEEARASVPHRCTALTAVKIVQALLGAGLVAALASVGARLFGPRIGLAAAAIVAVYPDLIWFSAHFWSETLFLLLLWWAIGRVLAADDGGSPATAALAGILWGLAVLTRETALYFVVVAGAWLAWKRGRSGLLRAGAFVVAALLVVAPWTYRNWVVFRAFIPVSTAGGQNLFQGNAPIPRDTTYVMVDEVQGRVEQYRYAMRMGLAAIWERQPTWIFEKLYEQMPNFWEADNLAIIHLKRGADPRPGGYGPQSVTAAWVVAAVTLLPYLAVLAGFVMGLRDLPLRRGTVLLLLFLLYYTALHIATHGFARYRLPAMPVLFVIAAWGFLAPAAARLRSAPRKAIAAAAAFVLVLCLIPGLRRTAAHPAFGGGGGGETAAPMGPRGE